MNIFALHPDPKIAASMHCDQHLHKMILEYAQMLSTYAYYTLTELELASLAGYIYKPSYKNHPCNVWLRVHNREAVAWLVDLALELDSIRRSLGATEHSSIQVIHAIDQSCVFSTTYTPPKEFVFCGPAHIGLDFRLSSVREKYQEYYKWKARMWALDKSRRMCYKGRTIPDFLTDCEYVDS